jgi:hypothetical protein
VPRAVSPPRRDPGEAPAVLSRVARGGRIGIPACVRSRSQLSVLVATLQGHIHVHAVRRRCPRYPIGRIATVTEPALRSIEPAGSLATFIGPPREGDRGLRAPVRPVSKCATWHTPPPSGFASALGRSSIEVLRLVGGWLGSIPTVPLGPITPTTWTFFRENGCHHDDGAEHQARLGAEIARSTGGCVSIRVEWNPPQSWWHG